MSRRKKSSTKFKLVIDTNVWVSALFWQGSPRKIFDQFTKGAVTVYFSDETWQEWQTKIGSIAFNLGKKKEFSGLMKLIKKRIAFVFPKTTIKVCRDADDNKFLETAWAAKVGYLVSGDQDLLTLKQYKGIKIVTPKQMLEILYGLG